MVLRTIFFFFLGGGGALVSIHSHGTGEGVPLKKNMFSRTFLSGSMLLGGRVGFQELEHTPSPGFLSPSLVVAGGHRMKEPTVCRPPLPFGETHMM